MSQEQNQDFFTEEEPTVVAGQPVPPPAQQTASPQMVQPQSAPQPAYEPQGYTPGYQAPSQYPPQQGYAPGPQGQPPYGYQPPQGYAPYPPAGMVICPRCGQPTGAQFPFCQACGLQLNLQPPKQKKAGKIPKKAFLFGGIGLAALLIIVLAVSLLGSLGGGSAKMDPFAAYVQEGEIWYSDLSEDGEQMLSSRLTNGEFVDHSEMAEAGYVLSGFTAISENGRYMFYPDRIGDGNTGLSIYRRDLTKPEEEPVKVDSDISEYIISSDGKKIVYLKGEEGSLYISDLEEKEKITSNVLHFDATEDLERVAYVTAEFSVYLWEADGETQKVVSDFQELVYVSEDLSTYYFTRENGLYVTTAGGGDKVKLAADVSTVLKVYEDGTIYYTKAVPVTLHLADYVNDDMAEADAAIIEPAYPTYPAAPSYPYWFNFQTDEEYEAAMTQYELDYAAFEEECQRISEEYNAAYDLYWQKTLRDGTRAMLELATLDTMAYSLYYYDGTTETLLTDAMSSEWSYNTSADAAVISYSENNPAELPKVNLSEIESEFDVRYMVEDALSAGSRRCLAVGANVTPLETESATSFRLSADGTALYYLDNVVETANSSVCEVYQVAIEKGVPAAPVLYDADVSAETLYMDGNSLVYYKNVFYTNGVSKGELYVDGVEIDFDVKLYSDYFADGVIYYYTDWNENTECGTLKMYKKGEKTKIADDVYDYQVLSNGDVLYLYDYSLNYYSGSLYLYHRGEAERLADDVVYLMDVASGGLHGWSSSVSSLANHYYDTWQVTEYEEYYS